MVRKHCGKENTVGKGEIARVFKRLVLQTHKKKTGLIWERANPVPDKPVLGSSNSTANKDMMSKI